VGAVALTWREIMRAIHYKDYLIVPRSKGVDLLNPHTHGFRVVKSVRAAKWRITRASNMVVGLHKTADKIRGLV
jgi:hypothetical protein